MNGKIFTNLLVILLLAALTAPWLAVIAAAKPLEPNPSWGNWPANALWGASLRIENNSLDAAYFGAKTGAEHVYGTPPLPPVTPYIWMVFVQEGVDYAEITRTEPAAPQHYTWYVKMVYNNSGTGDNVTARIWAELENADDWFIPQDYSVILENQAKGIGPWNLRKENGSINLVDSVTKYATLYVDNAMNVSISPSSQSGTVGDNASFTVTVQNTGRYQDNYSINIDASGLAYAISPSSLSINAGDNAAATLTVTLGTGSNVINVIADGAYANDNASCTVTGTAAGQRYNLTVNVSPLNSGSVTLDPPGGTYAEGTDVTATANPYNGYEFDNWSGDASGTSRSISVTMNSNKSITAHFISTGEGKAGGELPWTWIGLGITIVVVIIVAVVVKTHRRLQAPHVLRK
jgi:plastocyanin